jgi:hypothetical protein
VHFWIVISSSWGFCSPQDNYIALKLPIFSIPWTALEVEKSINPNAMLKPSLSFGV